MISNKTLIRILVMLVAVVLIVLALPRNDRQTYAYEQGEPWRYPLLTAPFDIPIYLDSVTVQRATDSVTRNFSPFVIYADTARAASMRRLEQSGIPALKLAQLRKLLGMVYDNGIMSTQLKKRVNATNDRQIRMMGEDASVSAIDASRALSTEEACKWICDHYQEGWAGTLSLTPEDVERLRSAVKPNITPDNATDSIYLSQALLSISSGQGKIAQGQRIVDRGEIVTPQIYTNLRTYEEMLTKTEADSSQSLFVILGQFAYVIVIFTTLYIYLAIYRPGVYANTRMMVFLVSLITFIVLFTVLMFETFTLGIYLVPFATVPVMVLIFIDSRTAVFSLIAAILISALVAIYQFQFIFLEFVAGVLATFSLRQLASRSQLLRTSVLTFVAYCISFTIVVVVSQGSLDGIDPKLYLSFAINAVLLSLTYVLIFVIEKVFGFTSLVTLVEISDINNPLLRRLAEEAPGTFQHSMQVSTLATEAARAVGANTTLVRTGALYHDIGKLKSPVFFTENQHGVNPHDGLDPAVSARKIISHVHDGEEMAIQAKLPAVIRNFILEHHGKGITRYFYNTAFNAAGGNPVDPAPYTYPGPNPQSKETAILMMADAVEAASRSLKEYSHEAIDRLVNKIIDNQVADGMFSESPISFSDVEKVKDTFKKRLATIYHTRVSYPERKTSAAPSDSTHSAAEEVGRQR